MPTGTEVQEMSQGQDDPSILKRALERERAARESAEALLEEKTRSLYEANTQLQSQFHNLTRKTAALEFLQDVAKIGANGNSFEDALHTFLLYACAYCRWPVAHIYLATPDGQLVSSRIWHLTDRKYQEFRTLTETTTFRAGEGLPGRVLESGSAAWISDITMDANFPRASALKTNSVRSAFAVPIILGDKVGAVLEFFSGDFTTEDKVLLDVVMTGARQLGALLTRDLAQQQLLNSEKMASLGEMAGGMAHEINTPLGAITLSASQLKDLLPSDIENRDLVEEIVADILSSSERISRIVRGLKNFSRDSTKNGELVFTDLVTVLKESLALCDMKMKEFGVTLELTECPDGLDIQCNPSQMGQVIVNLVNNARDAVAELPEKWVHVSLKGDGDFAELRVTDSGGGIPAAVREKLFQPFFTTKKIGSGTGLGLSIVHGIVKNHAGQIFVDSNSPNTTFVVRLPKFRSV